MNIKQEIIISRKSYSKKSFAYSYIKKEKAEKHIIGNCGAHDLNRIIYGYSVGFSHLYSVFLPRVISWISEGINAKEAFGDLRFHQYLLSSRLALAQWLKTGANDIQLWKNALKWQEELYKDADYSKGMGICEREEFALQILHYIHAEEYEKGIALYQSVQGDKPFKLYAKMSGFRIAYAYCLHFHENKFTVEQLEKVAKPFLEKQFVELYCRMGSPAEMLCWLKMVCDAREKVYTPEEVIYTFYEYIPEDQKPDFIKELLGEIPKKRGLFARLFKW